MLLKSSKPKGSLNQTTVSNCRALVFHYLDMEPSGDSPDTTCQIIEIQKECLTFDFSKSLGNPSGQFTLQVTANINWKKKVFAGDWIVVYLSNEGKEYMRLFGNIDRVSQFTTRNDKGLLETSYIISGRDFGKVFEKTNIWFNPLNTTRLLLSVLYANNSPSGLVGHFLDVFLGGKISIDAIMTQPQLNQWRVPGSLSALFKAIPSASPLGTPRFYDILTKQIQSVSGRKAIKSFASVQGPLWGIMKGVSNDSINEMYCELLDDKPTLMFRTRPFVKKPFTGGTIQGEVNYFDDLERVTIKGSEIIGTDIGYSDDERYNLFLMTTSSDFLSVEGLMSQLKPSFPAVNKASIALHGLSPMYVDTDFALIQGDGKNAKINPQLLKDWNNLLYNFYKDSIFMEAGTIEIKKANPKIRVGKALLITEATVNNNKIFYIEGYSDSWSFPGNWNQTLHLTRGQYLDKNLIKFTHEVEKEGSIFTGQSVVSRVPNKGNVKGFVKGLV